MFKAEVDDVIQFIVDSNRVKSELGKNFFLLDSGVTQKEALYIKFEVRVRDFKAKGDRIIRDEELSCPVHMIFFGDTSVFFYADKNLECSDIPSPELFVNTSNHNSCWRSDGFSKLNELYFDMCEEINPKMDPDNLESYVNFSFVSMKKVDVTYASAEDYGCNLLSITKKEVE